MKLKAKMRVSRQPRELMRRCRCLGHKCASNSATLRATTREKPPLGEPREDRTNEGFDDEKINVNGADGLEHMRERLEAVRIVEMS